MPRDFTSEGMTGIEPALSVWKTEALPLSYIPERSTNSSTPLAKNQILATRIRFRRSEHLPGTHLGTSTEETHPSATPEFAFADLWDMIFKLSKHGVWRSLVAHSLWERRVAGSNPVTPTTHRKSRNKRSGTFLFQQPGSYRLPTRPITTQTTSAE